MRVLQVRNVHEGLPRGLQLLDQIGIKRDSRNGPVIVAPYPVTTVYGCPNEKVIFWPERNANPFFHLYESLWMLAGRNDVAPLERYVKNSINYSDDGKTLHGAYGYRWRREFTHFSRQAGVKSDQLEVIANRLKENPDDRRCILQMWDARIDLGKEGKDFPCNTIATFQRGFEGELNLTVFCRSNDIIWGCYGANAVQFGTLLEYMALWVGCPIGVYNQVSVNYHAYDNEVWKQVEKVRPDRVDFIENLYIDHRVHVVPMTGTVEEVDKYIETILRLADNGGGSYDGNFMKNPWFQMVYTVLRAHTAYSVNKGEEKFEQASDVLKEGDQKADWIVASTEWLNRRHTKYHESH